MNTNTLALLGSAFLVCSALGCGKKADPGAVPAIPGAEAGGEAADSQLEHKLGHYIECFNHLSDSVSTSQSRYLSWANPKGVTGKERNVYGLFEVSHLEACSKELGEAKASAPSLPDVEAAADAYKGAAEALSPLVAKAHRYYEQEDYKDDKFEAAKAMHEPLLKAFTDFAAADKALRGKVEPLHQQVAERRLTRLSQDPARKVEYFVERLSARAKQLVEASEIETLAELEPTAYQQKLTDYDTALTELEALAKTDQAAEKAQSHLGNHARDLLKESKDLLRRKRSNEDFRKEFLAKSSPQMVHGHPAAVIDKYNDLVGDFNLLSKLGF